MLLALIGAGCGADGDGTGEGDQVADPQDRTEEVEIPTSIRIGVVGPLSGPAAAVGNSVREGVELVVEHAQADERFSGVSFEVLTEDDEGQAELAVTAVTRLIDQGVSAIIGPAQSTAFIAAMELGARSEMPLITPVAASPGIMEQGNQWVFRTAASDTEQGRAVGDAIIDGDVSQVAILYVDDDYGRDGQEVLTQVLEDGGVQVVSSVAYPVETQDFTPEVARTVRSQPNAIVIWGRQADSALILERLAGEAFEGRVFGSGGLGAPFFVNLAGEHAEGIIFPTTFVADASDAARRFAEDYRSRFDKEPDQFSAQGYVAGLALIEAVAEAGTADDHAAIRDALLSVRLGETPVGTFAFESNGESNIEVQLARWQGGVPTPVER